MKTLITILLIFSGNLFAQTTYYANQSRLMKKLLTILFICLLQNGFAGSYTGVIHYVSTTGNDATGDGTIGNPWKSLYKACNSVSTPGDTIYINPGTYTETQPANLSVGVSIKGAGTSSHVISNYAANWNFNDPTVASIYLSSTTEGTSGNQSISNILLDGNSLTGTIGIMVKCRSNVTIHDMTIKDFYINGISYFGSSVNSETKPTTYSINNIVHHVVIDNCTDSDATWVGGGLININGQKDMQIHDCILSDTSRPQGRNGDIVINNRFGLGFKYFNNTSYKPTSTGDHWNFHLEIPWGLGGTEIYNNNFYGGDQAIDVAANAGTDESYPYLFSIHNNYFEDIDPSQDGAHGKYAISIEGALTKNVLVYSNTFKNIVRPLSLTDGTSPGTASHDSNIVFRNNLCLNLGLTAAGSYQMFVEINKAEAGGSIYGLQIINNTLVPNSTVNASAFAITNYNGSVMRNIVIANNIITNGRNGYWMTVDNTGSTLDSLIIRNNILYNNPNSNAVSFTGNAVTNYINSGNITSNPLLNTDGSLQAGSPAIGAAYPYGYGVDIGALQYTVAAPTISISGNQTITVDNTSVSAVATWASGHTGTYAWTKISGPGTTTIGSPTSASTTVMGLQTGTYVLRCTVTQDDSQSTYAEVTITVNIPNVPPTANAGTDQTITLPTSQVTLSGSGTDTDGTIASYSWSKVSGGAATITSPSSATTTVTGLAAGVYVFRLTVTDNNGSTGTDDVQVTVTQAAPPNALIQFRTPHKFINQ